MKAAVLYKGIWIAQNSHAYKLWSESKFKELDQHIKMVEAQYNAAIRFAK